MFSKSNYELLIDVKKHNAQFFSDESSIISKPSTSPFSKPRSAHPTPSANLSLLQPHSLLARKPAREEKQFSSNLQQLQLATSGHRAATTDQLGTSAPSPASDIRAHCDCFQSSVIGLIISATVLFLFNHVFSTERHQPTGAQGASSTVSLSSSSLSYCFIFAWYSLNLNCCCFPVPGKRGRSSGFSRNTRTTKSVLRSSTRRRKHYR